MKISINNGFNNVLAKEGIINYIMPIFATLIIDNNSNEIIDSIFVNNEPTNKKEIDICRYADIDLKIVFNHGQEIKYEFKSIIDSVEKTTSNDISRDYSKYYATFHNQINGISEEQIINSIKNKSVSLFAINEFINATSKERLFKGISKRCKNIKHISERPKTHLKASSEVRPIETVKRVGYESIPYLSAHSEDWQAKTASGLKPARLLSRVEEINYEIYENIVVKSTIDLACKVFKTLKNRYEEDYKQLSNIIGALFSANIFGFDESFAKALNKDLLSTDNKSIDKTLESKDHAEKYVDLTKKLYKFFVGLKNTKLYGKIKKAKNISNPLQETNILLMDKDYKEIPRIWEILHTLIGKKTIIKEKNNTDVAPFNTYLLFCLSVAYYSLYSLNFFFKGDGKFFRSDGFSVSVSKGYNVINVDISNDDKCRLDVTNDMFSPIGRGEEFNGIGYDGEALFWAYKLDDDIIESFCKKVFSGSHDYKIQNRERNVYSTLKRRMIDKNTGFRENRKRITILPLFGLLNDSNSVLFSDYISNNAKEILKAQNSDYLVVALPVCNEVEQIKTHYSANDSDVVSILPISLLEINSYRRLQKVFLKVITEFMNDSCPFCGGGLMKYGDKYRCFNCGLVIVDTQCANETCKHKYRYLHNDLNADNLNKIRTAAKEFHITDSLFQYRDVVTLIVDEKNKIRPCCPKCGN